MYKVHREMDFTGAGASHVSLMTRDSEDQITGRNTPTCLLVNGKVSPLWNPLHVARLYPYMDIKYLQASLNDLVILNCDSLVAR